MQRPVWEGHLRLSLVSCPVVLFGATSRANDISFRLLHKKTHNRIRMVPHDPELGEVERKDLVKGFEISKNKFIVMTAREIADVRLPSTKNIDIESFVDAADIDRIYWNDPYYLAPNGKAGVDAYGVIRAAMEKSAKIALGRLVLHTRERIVALEPRGRGILLTTLRSHDEIRAAEDFFDDVPAGKPDRKMLDIAEKIIEQQAGAFDPGEFNDRYEDALRALIKRKQKGSKAVEAVAPDEADNVVDLMDALRQSLKGNKGDASRAKRFVEARTGTRKRKPARKSA